MTETQLIILALAFFTVATLYTTVGHAGASGYLATMALVGVAPDIMRPTALTLNILVAAITVYRFRRARFFSWKALWPFLAGSVPLAAVGGALRLPPGTYRLRTLVRNASTGRMGLTIFPLQVPAFTAGEPYLLPPVFLESPGDWMSVSGRGKSASGGIEPSSYPYLSLGAENMWPAALPRFRPGDASRVCLVAYHFGVGDSGELRLGSQILAADGQPLEGGKLAVLGKSVPEPDGKRMLLLSFTTPPGLGPGRYGLRIVLEDPATGQARQASAPFLVP